MIPGEQLTYVISGSFKFKPEIDETFDEFQDNGIKVLAPAKGWLFLPRHRLIRIEEESLRLLPAERDMKPDNIELEFLRLQKQAHFSYLFNSEDYVGISAALEIGAAMVNAISGEKPIYAHKPIDIDSMLKWQGWENGGQLELLRQHVRVVPIPEIYEDYCEYTKEKNSRKD